MMITKIVVIPTKTKAILALTVKKTILSNSKSVIILFTVALVKDLIKTITKITKASINSSFTIIIVTSTLRRMQDTTDLTAKTTRKIRSSKQSRMTISKLYLIFK